ncbi:MAG: hydrogenase nickel incorporation protein HypB [candidate division WOR-3 bacterium]|nr:MAG: hydrogenase nickel incorporation protein HypB [candidate division WOR-3 bacterium]
MKKVNILKPVLVSNKERASQNKKFFNDLGAFVINIIASPGAGKTSVIERIIQYFEAEKILVIEGDIRGQTDSERLRKTHADVVQINTLTECHLDAFMIAQVLPEITQPYDIILVENVGNLVCPAEFEIGEDFKLAILSTPEGDDKPIKYPLLFHLAAVVVVNKSDLLPHVDFNVTHAKDNIEKENKRARVFTVSAKTGEGFDPLCTFLAKKVDGKKKNKN